MDFNLKQWRHDSKEQEEQNIGSGGGPPSLKLPKLVHNNSDHEYSQHNNPPSALPLFVLEPNTTTNLSAHSSHHASNTPTKFPRMESYFSLTQWQELELQALIFRHMIAGAAVPPELLHLVNKSLTTSSNPPLFSLSHPLQQHCYYYPHYQPALVQSGYWGRGAMDAEPGRCRRTDGKKWRCSRDVVTGQKYCERHVNRGRNRSRKPVEIATSAATAAAAAAAATQGMASNGGIPHFTLSGPSPSMDLLHLSRRPSDSIIETTGPYEAQNEAQPGGTRTFRHFFNDWPRSLDDANGTTNLSISMPGNASSDFSLKLGTGDEDESVTRGERERPNFNWVTTWEAHPVGPMGGPLAEALRSSTSNCSPTSVLHRLSRGSTSEASSYVGS